jgi:uncharacterized cofD-like protein
VSTAVAGPGDGTRAVALGGGHGLSRTLAALVGVVDHVTAVVTVADDGGSSGRLRRDIGGVAPGDLRMALAALARDRELAALVQYRFARGELAGHSLGNLVLVAMQELAGGDVVAGLDRLARLLDVPGRVLPCTTTPLTLHARTPRGVVRGQATVARTPGLERVWIDPACPPATPDAVAAIARADLVVLGPGSLFTSLVPNLLVPGIADAVAAAGCPTVFVANLREQAGETEGLTLPDHLRAVAVHVPGVRFDVLLAHDGVRGPDGIGALLAAGELHDATVGRVVTADLFDGHDGHDPGALAVALRGVLHAR